MVHPMKVKSFYYKKSLNLNGNPPRWSSSTVSDQKRYYRNTFGHLNLPEMPANYGSSRPASLSRLVYDDEKVDDWIEFPLRTDYRVANSMELAKIIDELPVRFGKPDFENEVDNSNNLYTYYIRYKAVYSEGSNQEAVKSYARKTKQKQDEIRWNTLSGTFNVPSNWTSNQIKQWAYYKQVYAIAEHLDDHLGLKLLIHTNIKYKNIESLYLQDHPMRGNISKDEYFELFSDDEEEDYKKFIRPKHYGKSLSYKILDTPASRNIKQRDGKCVIDYLYSELTQTGRKYKRLTKYQLEKEISQFGDISDGISVDIMFKWIKLRKNISAHSLDPMFKVFKKHIAERPDVTLCFIVNSNHCHPITDKQQKKFISGAGRLDLKAVQWNLNSIDYKFIGNDMDFKNYKHKILVTSNDIMECMHKVMNDTGFNIDQFNIINGNLISFQHPITEQIITDGTDYKRRKMISDTIYNDYPIYNFTFRNQSICKLSLELFHSVEGSLQNSKYNIPTRDIMDKYSTKPLIDTLLKKHELAWMDGDSYGVDHKTSYTYALEDNQNDYPVYNEFCKFEKCPVIEFDEEYGCYTVPFGEYLVDTFQIPQLGGLRFDRQIHSTDNIRFLLNNNYLDISKIHAYIKPSGFIPANTFKKFVKYLKNNFDKDEYKPMINQFIGCLNTKWSKSDRGCITQSWDTVCGLYYQYKEQADPIIDEINGNYFFRLRTQTRRSEDSCPIWRQIVCRGQRNLMEMIKDTMTDEMKMIGYNTDAVFYIGGRKDLIDYGERYKDEPFKPKKWKTWETRDEFGEIFLELKWNKTLVTESGVICGVPGSGKTHTLLQKCQHLQEIQEPYLILTYQNSAKANIMEKADEMGFKPNVFTFDSYFYEGNSKNIDKFTHIFVDEVFNVPKKWIFQLYDIKVRFPNIHFQLIGDWRQNPPVEDDYPHINKKNKPKSRWYDYKNEWLFGFIADFNWDEIEYKAEYSRYTPNTRKILKYIEETGVLPHKYFKPIDDNLETNIVSYNTKTIYSRNNINNKFAPNGIKEGMKIICETNEFKKINLYNNKLLICPKIIKNMLIFKDVKIHKKYFRPAYAMTNHKYQGHTIKKDYNIHHLDKFMTRNALINAIGRCEDYRQIHLNPTKTIFEWAEPEDVFIEYRPRPQKIGQIYRIDHSEGIYIGRTARDIKKREQEHKLKNKKTTMLCKLGFFKMKSLDSLETMYLHFFQSRGYKITNKRKLKQLKPDVEISKPTIDTNVNKFNIIKYKSEYRINCRIDGKKITKKVRFGKRTTEKDAYLKIRNIRQELLQKYS